MLLELACPGNPGWLYYLTTCIPATVLIWAIMMSSLLVLLTFTLTPFWFFWMTEMGSPRPSLPKIRFRRTAAGGS